MDDREIIFRTVLPRLKHQDMSPPDFYGIHREHNIQFCEELLTQLRSYYKQKLLEKMPKEKDLDRCPASEEIDAMAFNSALSQFGRLVEEVLR